jgi:hypothetical protein
MEQVAFLSLDPVHEEYAREMAATAGIDLDVRFPKEPFRLGECAAVICDLDFWPREGQDRWLSELRTNRPSCRVAVFSYRMNERRAAALRRQGIAVFRGLGPELFLDLRPKARQR